MANRLFVRGNYLVFIQNVEESDPNEFDIPLGGIYRERRKQDEYEVLKTTALTTNLLQFPFPGFRIKLIQDDFSILQNGDGDDFSSD